ncbi:MAG: hypothetical protein CL610_16630 [Anaerolineaceae bacterium]|nr:hypothetical protein [Anaerolineaceae bacterium]
MNDRANPLLQTFAFLASGLQADTHLCLAATVAWLDPAWILDDDIEVDEDETSTLAYAFFVLRKAFPNLYVQATEMLRTGRGYAEIDRLICAEMYQKGIPLDELTWLAYGIPMPAYGARLNDPDFYEGHDDLASIVHLFGIETEESTDVPLNAYRAGRLVATSLMGQGDVHYQQVSYLLQWLFNCSGNSCVDMNDEDMAEMQPLSWDPVEIAFAQAIIQEADEIMEQALAGLEWLMMQPTVTLALQENVHRVNRVLKKRGEKRDEPRIRLHWPRLTDSTDGAAKSIA